MKHWQLAGVCILLAIVIFQGALINNLNTQIMQGQTQTTTYHNETLTKVNRLLANDAQIEAQLRALMAGR